MFLSCACLLLANSVHDTMATLDAQPLIDALCTTTPIASYLHGWCDDTIPAYAWEGIVVINNNTQLASVEFADVPLNVDVLHLLLAPTLTRVVSIELRNCSLTGDFESNAAEKPPNLRKLDLSHNALTGTLTHVTLSNIAGLNVSHNLLGHTTEAQLCATMPDLVELDISYNGIAGNLDNCSKSTWPHAKYVNLSHNRLTGTLPVPSSVVRHFDLSHNKLDRASAEPLPATLSLRLCNIAQDVDISASDGWISLQNPSTVGLSLPAELSQTLIIAISSKPLASLCGLV